MVGVTRFELATSSSRTKRATKLRHTPKLAGFREPHVLSDGFKYKSGKGLEQTAQPTSQRLGGGVNIQDGNLGAAEQPDRRGAGRP